MSNSMDGSFTNVVEGTRRFFLGLPHSSSEQSGGRNDNEAPSQSAARPVWSGASPHTPQAAEATPAQSGAPAMPNSRPPSVASVQPPRPPSEGLLEPEPHIIHKATVVQQALQKQREEEALLNSPNEIERPALEMAMSPPTHIIHKPSHAISDISKSTEPSSPRQNFQTLCHMTSSVPNCPSPSKSFMQPPPSPLPNPSPLQNTHNTPPHPRNLTPSPHLRTMTPSPRPRPHTPSPHTRTPTPVNTSTSNYPEHQSKQEKPHYHRMEVPRQSHHSLSASSGSDPTMVPPLHLQYSKIDPYSRKEFDNEVRGQPNYTQQMNRIPETYERNNPQQPSRRISVQPNPSNQQNVQYQVTDLYDKNHKHIGTKYITSNNYNIPHASQNNDRVPPIIHPGNNTHDMRNYALPPTNQFKPHIPTPYEYQEKYVQPYRHTYPHQSHQYPTSTSYGPQPIQSSPSANRIHDSREVQRGIPVTKTTMSSQVHHPPESYQRQYQDYRIDSRNPSTSFSRALPQNSVQHTEPSRPQGTHITVSSYEVSAKHTSYTATVSHANASRNHPQSHTVKINSHSGPIYTTTVPPGKHFLTATPATHVPSVTYESNSQISPTRALPAKPGYGNHQPKMTVSVTTLVNQMNQTKQGKPKRESPLDLSVKTVKNSADSTDEIEPRLVIEETVPKHHTNPKEVPSTSANSRLINCPVNNDVRMQNSLKIDFSPNFHSTYTNNRCHAVPIEKTPNLVTPRVNVPAAHQGSRPYDSIAGRPYVKRVAPEPYIIDNRYQPKYKHQPSKRIDQGLPRIDLTKAIEKDHLRDVMDQRIAEDSRKRLGGPSYSNIPEKIMRYETWTADSRIEKHTLPKTFSHSAREEQHKLMRQPVYSYSSHKQLEAYQQYEQKKTSTPCYQNSSHYPPSSPYDRYRDSVHNQKHLERQRQATQKLQPPRLTSDFSGVPADKNVLSILRNSLETKSLNGSTKTEKPVTIVIDDGEDSITELSDLAKNTATQNEKIQPAEVQKPLKFHMPKAVDSIRYDTEPSQKPTGTDEPFHKITVDSDKKTVINKSPEGDFASRIRTKAELKGFTLPAIKKEDVIKEKVDVTPQNLKPRSQKEHLFSQLQQESETAEALNKLSNLVVPQETTPAEPLKKETDQTAPKTPSPPSPSSEDDMYWGNMCDSFMEQLKTKFVPRKKRSRDELSCEYEIKQESEFSETTSKDDINAFNHHEGNMNITTSENVQLGVSILSEHRNSLESDKNAHLENIKIKEEPLDDSEMLKEIEKPTLNMETENLVGNSMKIIGCKNISFLTEMHIKKETEDIVCTIKQEADSSDDDLPLIKSKILKEKQNVKGVDRQHHELRTKPLYVKLENCNFETKSKLSDKSKLNIRRKTRRKSHSSELISDQIKHGNGSSHESETEDHSRISRLRTRKPTKCEESKLSQNPTKLSPKKTLENNADEKVVNYEKYHFQNKFPGWEEELYRYKRSLRMPSRLINVPKSISRISSSLPDLDPCPVSPAPSTSTDELFIRKHASSVCDANDKIESDLESDCSSLPKVNYDSETSNSTTFSGKSKRKNESIIDLLIQKYGKKAKKKIEVKNNNFTKGCKENIETKNKSMTNTTESEQDNSRSRKAQGNGSKIENMTLGKIKSRLDKTQRTLGKEQFSEDRPASAPPSCTKGDSVHKKEPTNVCNSKMKFRRKILKDKVRIRSNIREGLRSTRSKGNDAKGRLLRLKKRNNVIISMKNKKMKKMKKEPKAVTEDGIKREVKDEKDDIETSPETAKKKLRRLFARRKLSSGFDYLKKKKKIVRKEEGCEKKKTKISKPSPSSINDLHKEIKGWIINKSVGETHLHRAARLGYTDCIAYCLENMSVPPSCRDNAGFTPLHVAAQRGHLQIAKILLQYGADVSASAQGGICPLHEACENDDIELIRLLLSYGADPTLATYSGSKPIELVSGEAAKFLEQHIADTLGKATEPWYFEGPSKIFDPPESGCDVVRSPPERSPSPATLPLEFVSAAIPLPPLYTLRPDSRTHYCLLHDLLNVLQVKSKDALLKQIYSGSGSPKDILKELKTQEFLERAQCQQFMAAGEKINIRASKIALIPYTDKVKELLDVDSVMVT